MTPQEFQVEHQAVILNGEWICRITFDDDVPNEIREAIAEELEKYCETLPDC